LTTGKPSQPTHRLEPPPRRNLGVRAPAPRPVLQRREGVVGRSVAAPSYLQGESTRVCDGHERVSKMATARSQHGGRAGGSFSQSSSPHPGASHSLTARTFITQQQSRSRLYWKVASSASSTKAEQAAKAEVLSNATRTAPVCPVAVGCDPVPAPAARRPR